MCKKAVLCIMGKDICAHDFIHEQVIALFALSSVLTAQQASQLDLMSTTHTLESPE